MGRRAVTLHPRSEELQSAEHGIERIERAGARDDEHVGAASTQRLELLGDGSRAGAGVPHRQQTTPEPVDLLAERRLEARALLGLELLTRDGTDGQRPERADGALRAVASASWAPLPPTALPPGSRTA